MEGYRRPDVVIAEFRDATGDVIPYGERWWGTPSDELPYSVTEHPERFAPVAEVGRALAAALPDAHRAGGAGTPVDIEITDFPGVIVRVAGRSFPFPDCGCDACDDNVTQVIENLEELVDAVADGRYAGSATSFRYWGAWGSRRGSDEPDGSA